MKKCILRFIFVCVSVVLLSPAVFASKPVDSEPTWSDVSAQSFCLMDGDSGDVLRASNEDQRLPMASTTKIMTCLVALEEGDIHSEVIVPSEAVGIEGSSMYLVKGEKLTLHELLYGLMLESANDAAVAIALHLSGSIDAFSDLMNEKAKELGLVNTRFVNPNGLPADGHYSSARDLAVLMRNAMQNENFAEIASTQTKNVSAPDGKCRFLSNHNRLLRSYEDCIAGKTGYTKTAGRCLVTAAKRDGKLLICTTLGAPDDWQDHKELYSAGFALYDNRNLLDLQSFVDRVSVVGGEKSTISVVNSDAFACMLRSDESVETVVELPTFLYAPVSKGDLVGSLVFLHDGEELGRVSLIADSDCKEIEVKPNFWQRIWIKICEWFD